MHTYVSQYDVISVAAFSARQNIFGPRVSSVSTKRDSCERKGVEPLKGKHSVPSPCCALIHTQDPADAQEKNNGKLGTGSDMCCVIESELDLI